MLFRRRRPFICYIAKRNKWRVDSYIVNSQSVWTVGWEVRPSPSPPGPTRPPCPAPDRPPLIPHLPSHNHPQPTERRAPHSASRTKTKKICRRGDRTSLNQTYVRTYQYCRTSRYVRYGMFPAELKSSYPHSQKEEKKKNRTWNGQTDWLTETRRSKGPRTLKILRYKRIRRKMEGGLLYR